MANIFLGCLCVCCGGGVYTCTCIYQSSLQLRENCYSIWLSLPPYSFAITNNEQTFFFYNKSRIHLFLVNYVLSYDFFLSVNGSKS